MRAWASSARSVELLAYVQPRDWETAQRYLEAGYEDRQAAKAIYRTLELRSEAGPPPGESASLPGTPTRAAPYSRTPRTQARGEYQTWKRGRLIAAVQERPGSSIEDLALMAEMSTTWAAIALRLFEQRGAVTQQRAGRKISWTITTKGVEEIERYRRRFSGTFPRSTEAAPPAAGERSKLALLLEAAQTVSRELRGLGWYPGPIREALEEHNVTYILGLLRREDLKAKARDLGALLYSILLGDQKERGVKRIAGLTSVLKGLGAPIRRCFTAVAERLKMSFREARYLACSLRKVHGRGRAVLVGDVQGIAGWIMKKRC